MNHHRTPSPPDDDDTVATLEAALRSGLGSGPVDVQALASGTRRGVRRARARRRATIGAAALVVAAVPLGYATVLDRTAVPAQVAATSFTTTPEPTTPWTTAPATAPTTAPTTSPTPPTATTAVPTASEVTPPVSVPEPSQPVQTSPSDDPNVTAYPIPDAVAFTPADLPAGQRRGVDTKQYRYQPTVLQQSCQEDRPGARPIAGRQWGWYDERRLSETTSIDHVVTGWAPGTGPARFADLVQDRGQCRWLDPVRPVAHSGLPGDEAWAATTVSNRLTYGIAAVRVGDVIVGVTVMHPDGVRPAVALAKKLVTVATQRVVAERVGTG